MTLINFFPHFQQFMWAAASPKWKASRPHFLVGAFSLLITFPVAIPCNAILLKKAPPSPNLSVFPSPFRPSSLPLLPFLASKLQSNLQNPHKSQISLDKSPIFRDRSLSSSIQTGIPFISSIQIHKSSDSELFVHYRFISL